MASEMRQICTQVLQVQGFPHSEIEESLEELLNYNQNTFTQLPAIDLSLSEFDLSQTSEPYIETWQRYIYEAWTHGVVPVLKRALVQLQFPIQSGISETEPYRAATRQGIRPSTRGGISSEGCCFEAPDQVSLKIHSSIAGLIPVITVGCRSDFETLVQALTKRNEPVPVPPAMGACMVGGYNNWNRVDHYRQQWSERCGGIPSERDWNAEFKQLIPQKELYQDRFIILSTAPYSNTTAAELGLTEVEWSAYSLTIRLEHECTHYFTLRCLKSMKNHLLDELIADYRGIIAALGYYRADWFLRFMGLENYPDYRSGGRSENYRGNLSDQAFQALQALVKRAAENLERFDQSYVAANSAHDKIAVILALTQLTLVELASESGDALIANAVDHILCRR